MNLGKNLKFGPLVSAALAVSPLGVAIMNTEGGYSVYNPDTGELTDVGEFTIDFPMNPFFATPTAEVVPGDLVQLFSGSKHKFAYVTEVKGKSVTFINPADGAEFSQTQSNTLFGVAFYTKVTSLIDFKGEATGVFGGMNPMALMMMSGGMGGSKDGENGGGDMMQMMMMSQMFGAGAGANPFDGLFGAKTPVKTPAKRKPAKKVAKAATKKATTKKK